MLSRWYTLADDNATFQNALGTIIFILLNILFSFFNLTFFDIIIHQR